LPVFTDCQTDFVQHQQSVKTQTAGAKMEKYAFPAPFPAVYPRTSATRTFIAI